MDLNRHTPQEMEEAIRRSIELIGEKECGSFDAMLAPRLIAVNHEGKSCTLSYHIADWMSNPIGIAHGGVLCAIADLSMGTLSKYYAKAATFTPTISIHLNYLRPVPLDGEIIVVSSIDISARRLNQLHSTIYHAARPDKPCVTATAAYFVPDES